MPGKGLQRRLKLEGFRRYLEGSGKFPRYIEYKYINAYIYIHMFLEYIDYWKVLKVCSIWKA